MNDDLVTIEGFHRNRLAPTAYQLKPYRIRVYNEDEEGLGPVTKVMNLSNVRAYTLMPGEYISVTPEEKISVAEGFIADFFPSSWCIENRIVLTLGRLDAHYEGDLVFGVFNAGRDSISLTRDFQLCRMTIAWLGKQNMPTYGKTPPGAYIKELAELRAEEMVLEEDAQALESRKEKIKEARDALEKLRDSS